MAIWTICSTKGASINFWTSYAARLPESRVTEFLSVMGRTQSLGQLLSRTLSSLTVNSGSPNEIGKVGYACTGPAREIRGVPIPEAPRSALLNDLWLGVYSEFRTGAESTPITASRRP